MLVVVTYDISDDSQRSQLANLLESYGRRVQKSVFECFLSLEEMRELHQKVARRFKLDEGSIRFYWISAEAVSRVLVIGDVPPQPPPDAYII